MSQYIYRRDKDQCQRCRLCITRVSCPSPHDCIGCQACYLACPSNAMIPQERKGSSFVTVNVDGSSVQVPGLITVKTALEHLGIHFERYPNKNSHFAPCQTGGCYACSVLVDNELLPSCHTAIVEGQNITTAVSDNIEPLRIVGWYQAHAVGGVGTPWESKSVTNAQGFAEAACFAAGCNLRCRTCQNYDVTYCSNAPAISPSEAARELFAQSKASDVKRVAISGGEATLNRPWLVRFFAELNQLGNNEIRLHLDTNATILTHDYIDELVSAGVTDIGPDLKTVALSTFQIITGIYDDELAQKYLDTEWSAIKYLVDEYYPELVFVGVGLPFNPAFYDSDSSMNEELHQWGSRILKLDERLQVTILDYRPEFRRREIQRPSIDKMRHVKQTLEDLGLKSVIAQTRMGHLPPTHLAPDRGDSK